MQKKMQISLFKLKPYTHFFNWEPREKCLSLNVFENLNHVDCTRVSLLNGMINQQPPHHLCCESRSGQGLKWNGWVCSEVSSYVWCEGQRASWRWTIIGWHKCHQVRLAAEEGTELNSIISATEVMLAFLPIGEKRRVPYQTHQPQAKWFWHMACIY